MAWRCRVPVRIAHNHSVPGGNEFKRNALKYFLRFFSKMFSTDYFACSEKAGRWMFGEKDEDGQDVGKIYQEAVELRDYCAKLLSDEREEIKRIAKENNIPLSEIGLEENEDEDETEDNNDNNE